MSLFSARRVAFTEVKLWLQLAENFVIFFLP